MAVLYVVATPIGNLEDITLRALRVLGEVEAIACEDTRQTAKLLNHYRLKKRLVSYHSHSDARAAGKILEILDSGADIALVSDGGTPGISDPGSPLVRAVRDAGHRTVPIPGPSALTALLSIAGAPVKGTVFEGFLSPKPGRRRRRLGELLGLGDNILLFESPHRILRLLEDLRDMAPERTVLLGRELTKIHEEILEGFPGALLTELAGRPRMVGEFAVLVWAEKRGINSIQVPPGTCRI
jgi:16S rRNA (cytidine1402-2'-O)-methyltransferase